MNNRPKPFVPDKLVEKRHEWHVQQARLEAAEEAQRVVPARVSTARSRTSRMTPTGSHRASPDVHRRLQIPANRGEQARREHPHAPRRVSERVGRSLPAADRVSAVHGPTAGRVRLRFRHGFATRDSSRVSSTPAALIWVVVVFLVARRLGQAGPSRIHSPGETRGGRGNACHSSRCRGAQANLARRATVDGARRRETHRRREGRRPSKKLTRRLRRRTRSGLRQLNGWAVLVSVLQVPGMPADPVETILRDGENDVRRSVQEAAVERPRLPSD